MTIRAYDMCASIVFAAQAICEVVTRAIERADPQGPFRHQWVTELEIEGGEFDEDTGRRFFNAYGRIRRPNADDGKSQEVLAFEIEGQLREARSFWRQAFGVISFTPALGLIGKWRFMLELGEDGRPITQINANAGPVAGLSAPAH